MDIGDKLKAARADSGMTQEQVAEALGVSRQTVSNWENNRTYPDIISVIRMSDLYAVSLDILLKEGKAMANSKTAKPASYTEFLAESTDTVRRRNSLEKVIEIGVYLVVWALCLDLYVFGFRDQLFDMPEGERLFRITVLWLALPVVTLIISTIIGVSKGWGKGKWWMMAFFGAMFLLMHLILEQYLVGGSPFYLEAFTAPEMFAAGAAVSGIGMAAGQFFARLAGKKPQ